jgi:hypothetical protein
MSFIEFPGNTSSKTQQKTKTDNMKTHTERKLTITPHAATLEAIRYDRGDRDVAADAHRRGFDNGEALIVALDALLRYADAYTLRFGDPLATDYVLGPAWLEAIKGVRGLLDGDGECAMIAGITTDSKDNGACEAMFWAALAAAGYTEETANL